MPTFEYFILGAPTGFSYGCKALNQLYDLNPSLLHNLNTFTEYDNESKTLNYIIRAYKQSSPKITPKEMAGVLDSGSFLSRNCIGELIEIIQQSESKNETLISRISGKLENFEWKIGVAVSSSICKNLYSPYVAISFQIVDVNEQRSYHQAELTYDEFKETFASFVKASKAMDAL